MARAKTERVSVQDPQYPKGENNKVVRIQLSSHEEQKEVSPLREGQC